MGPSSRSPLRPLLAVVIFSLVSCTYVNAQIWGKPDAFLSRKPSTFDFQGNVENNPNLNARRLMNLALPSYLGKLLQMSEGTQQDDEEPPSLEKFLEQLFENVDGNNCKAHVSEWYYRTRTIELNDTRWLGRENAWVLQLVDSWGKIPEGILRGHVTNFGDFDECVNVEVSDQLMHYPKFPNTRMSFGGRYCMTYMVPFEMSWGAAGKPIPNNTTPARTSSKSKDSGVGTRLKRSIEPRRATSLAEFQKYLTESVGILAPRPASATCMPSSCSPVDIQRIYVNGMNMLYHNRSENPNLRQLAWPFVQICTDSNKDKKLDGAAIFVIALITCLGALAICSGVYDYWLSHYAKDKKRPTSIGFKYLMAFSLYTNTRKWLSTRKSPEDFGCLHGIRSMTTMWVVLAHTYAVNMFVPQWNHYELFHMVEDSPTVLAIINGFFCVDTFFLMSGLLACYNILKLLDKTNGKLNIFMFYLHRYLRLTPTYAILVGIGATLFTHMGNGPYWYIMEVQEQFCKDNWWTNLLYVNNVVNTNRMCNGESWYLADDMQFYILSPFIVWPIWKWEKIGLLLTLVYFLASLSAFPILIHAHGTPPSTIVVRRMLKWQEMIYIRPYTRVGVFIVGIWLGWLLYKTKGKKVKIPLVGVIAGWMLSTAAALYAIYCIYPWYDPEYEIPEWYGYFYAAISRPLWGFAISWVIFACIKGYGGLINSFLSWSVFMPLGRLTFCVYLTSYHFQQMYLLRSTQAPQYDTYYLVNLFFAHFFLSCIVGYFCTLVFESPFMILQKLIFEGDPKKPAPNPKPKPKETPEAPIVEARLEAGLKVD